MTMAAQPVLPGVAATTGGRIVCFIGLNPSQAGGPRAGKDGNDPTMRREIGFARAWGYSGGRADGEVFSPCKRYRYVLFRPGLVKLNLYAWIATKPVELGQRWREKHLALSDDDPAYVAPPDPVGPDNDAHLANWIGQADLVVCAWGANRSAAGRSTDVLLMIRALGKVPHALRVTNGGHPEHTLYLPANLSPQEYGR